MTITRQQVDAWGAEVDAAYEAGRQEGMKQKRALWELSKLGQEIEAQPERTGWPAGLLQDDDRKLSKWLASKPDAKHIVDMAQPQRQWVEPTDEEIDRVTDAQWARNNDKPIYAAYRAYARAIAVVIKEKNT